MTTRVATKAQAVAATPFSAVRDAVASRFREMSEQPLFRVDVSRDALWETYLGAFEPGDDPVHKTRTEHDCQCCRHLIRTVGGVVAIDAGGDVQTLWGGSVVPGRYAPVLVAMDTLVKAAPVVAAATDLGSRTPPEGEAGIALNSTVQAVAKMFGNSAEDIKKYGDRN